MTMKKMNIENPFFDFMGRVGDVMLLNLFFLIFSLPVVTAGASFAALYQSFADMEAGEFVSAFRSFSGAWKKHLKMGVKVWLCLFFAGAVLLFDITFLGGTKGGWAWRLVSAGVGCLLVLWEMVFAYVFPVMVKEGGSVRKLMRRSMFLAVSNLPYTIVMAVLNSGFLLCFAAGGTALALAAPVYLVFGFGLTAYVNTALLRRCVWPPAGVS